VLTQIILNLCLASLTTCNKIYDIFAPGEKIRPRINIRTDEGPRFMEQDLGIELAGDPGAKLS
jgi:hypothetical protein